MKKMNEFAIEWTKDRKYATVSAPSNTALCNKMKRYAKTRPDEVTDLIENKDGSICCHVPVKWVKVTPPAKRNLTEEQRKEYSERMKRLRNNLDSAK